MSLRQKTILGVLWNFGEQLGRRGIGIVITLLLARYLVPEDFGLVAMMAVFLAVGSSLMESGFKEALIRMQNATQVDFSTAFFCNLALGLLSYIIFYLAAPFIAGFYEEPRLIVLIRVASLGILISAFQVVQSAILSRELNFKAQMQASIPASIISGVLALALAYAGLGVWALLVQMLASSFILTLILWRIQRWRPTSCFCYRSMIRMYAFGYKLFLSGLLDIIFKNIYIILIAKLFSTTIAGLYFFAHKIQELIINQLVSAIQRVTYPALSTIQDDDIHLKLGYRKVVVITTFLLFPATFLLAVLAQPLFELLLPNRWLSAVPYLQLMCLAALLYPLHSINLNILKVKGRSDLFLYLEVIKKVMVIVIIFLGIKYGIYGILIGQVVSSVFAYLPNSYFSAKLIGYPVTEQMADFMPGLILSAAVGGLVYPAAFWVQWSELNKVLVFGTAAALLYLAGAHVLKLQAYLLIKELFKHKLKVVRIP